MEKTGSIPGWGTNWASCTASQWAWILELTLQNKEKPERHWTPAEKTTSCKESSYEPQLRPDTAQNQEKYLKNQMELPPAQGADENIKWI